MLGFHGDNRGGTWTQVARTVKLRSQYHQDPALISSGVKFTSQFTSDSYMHRLDHGAPEELLTSGSLHCPSQEPGTSRQRLWWRYHDIMLIEQLETPAVHRAQSSVPRYIFVTKVYEINCTPMETRGENNSMLVSKLSTRCRLNQPEPQAQCPAPIKTYRPAAPIRTYVWTYWYSDWCTDILTDAAGPALPHRLPTTPFTPCGLNLICIDIFTDRVR